MSAFSRDMTGQAMIECGWLKRMQDGGSSSNNIAIKNDRHILEPCCQNSPDHRRNLTSAQTAEHLKRISKMGLVQRDSCPDGSNLPGQTRIINTGPTANPILGLAAIKRMINRSGDCCVADPHFAKTQEIRTASRRFHAESNGGGGTLLIHRRAFRDIAGWMIQREIKHLEADIEGGADLVDGRAARREILHHLPRDILREWRDTLGDHTVVGCKDGNQRPHDGRFCLALPSRDESGDLFKASQRPCRFGQLRVTFLDRCNGSLVRSAHHADERADIVKGKASGGHDEKPVRDMCRGSRDKRDTLLIGFCGIDKLEHETQKNNEFAPLTGWRALLRDFWHMVRFYSRLPTPKLAFEVDKHAMPDFGTAPRMLPFAALLIALPAAALLVAADAARIPPVMTAIFAIALAVLTTGAFHEDGLADTFDGLGGGATPERRLDIMKDSRIGTFGGVALVLSLMMRAALLMHLVTIIGASRAALIWIGAASLSRCFGLIPITMLPPARPDGFSAAVGRPTSQIFVTAMIIAFLITGACGAVARVPFSGSVIGIALATAVTGLMCWWALRTIHGQTGDIAGSCQQLAEIAFLTGILMSVSNA
jgi:adenosylcobinamide-GDP ribazoletransferase